MNLQHEFTEKEVQGIIVQWLISISSSMKVEKNEVAPLYGLVQAFSFCFLFLLLFFSELVCLRGFQETALALMSLVSFNSLAEFHMAHRHLW